MRDDTMLRCLGINVHHIRYMRVYATESAKWVKVHVIAAAEKCTLTPFLSMSLWMRDISLYIGTCPGRQQWGSPPPPNKSELEIRNRLASPLSPNLGGQQKKSGALYSRFHFRIIEVLLFFESSKKDRDKNKIRHCGFIETLAVVYVIVQWLMNGTMRV